MASPWQLDGHAATTPVRHQFYGEQNAAGSPKQEPHVSGPQTSGPTGLSVPIEAEETPTLSGRLLLLARTGPQ